MSELEHTTGALRAKAMAAGRAARLRDLSMVDNADMREGGDEEERKGEEVRTRVPDKYAILLPLPCSPL